MGSARVALAGCTLAAVNDSAALRNGKTQPMLGLAGILWLRRASDLPAFFGPVITGEQRQLKFVVRLRVLPGQREPALPTSAFRHPSQP